MKLLNEQFNASLTPCLRISCVQWTMINTEATTGQGAVNKRPKHAQPLREHMDLNPLPKAGGFLCKSG